MRTVLRPLLRPALGAACAGVLLVACASTDASSRSVVAADAGAAPAGAEGGGADDEGPDLELLAHEASMAERRLELARLELSAANERHEQALLAAREDLEAARADREAFREFDAPTRSRSAELDLRGTRDRAQEAEEELAQIMLMYEEQDLDDKTAEFVVQRGRRQAERAAERIAIEERNLAKLLEHTLPTEELKLVRAVERAERALGTAERAREMELFQKQLGIAEAEQALVGARKKLEKARAKANEAPKP